MESTAAAACKANISPAGRRRRLRFGQMWAVASLALLVVLIALRVPWYGGLALFIPAALAAVGLLQATRDTCIMRANEGTFENDDFSTVKAPDHEVAASRAVAAAIRRDVLLIGVTGSVIGVIAAILARRL
ncbi:MAG TPA: hypothetical protein VHG72_20925 [Polyangia bacterium]|nr:hypothetical protein [Polyangia bacterium]